MYLDDEAMKELDWKKLIGSYLIRAKYKVLENIDKKDRLTSKAEVELRTDSINDIAREELQGYDIEPKISTEKLLNALRTISESMKQLKEEEKAFYISSEGAITFKKNFILTTEEIENLLVEAIVK